MKRELNPTIFGQVPTPELGRSISAFDEPETPVLSLPNEVREELKALRIDLIDLEKETIQEIASASHQTQGFVDQLSRLFEGLSERITYVEAAIRDHGDERSEQSDVNRKIEALLARHNQIVRNFENKLVHLSRVLSEQEIQILNSKSALEEAHREISRLRS